MSKENPLSGNKPKLGNASEASLAFDDTLSHVVLNRPAPLQTDSEDVMTSAPVSSIQGSSQASGAVTLSGARILESVARDLIVRVMARAGIKLIPDYPLSHEDLLVTLDGFDPNRNIGFQFISHADADVVTDFDHHTENRLRELGLQNVAHVLVIHDYDAQDGDAVLNRVEAFLDALESR